MRFGLFRVRSPLLTESRLFSFPMGTEMFHFPTFPPAALCVQAEVAGHDSGIFRVSLFGDPRISLVTSSPGLIAGSYVLHRLLVPRHPPIALSSLLFYKDARVHCEILKQRANPNPTHPKTRHMSIWTAPKKRNRIFRTQQRAFWTNPQNPTSHFPLPSQPKDQKKLYSQTKIEPQGF